MMIDEKVQNDTLPEPLRSEVLRGQVATRWQVR
jgi:hypothetical protein